MVDAGWIQAIGAAQRKPDAVQQQRQCITEQQQLALTCGTDHIIGDDLEQPKLGAMPNHIPAPFRPESDTSTEEWQLSYRSHHSLLLRNRRRSCCRCCCNSRKYCWRHHWRAL